MAHERAEKTVERLQPDLVLWGGLYSGVFTSATGVYCDPVSGEIYVADGGSNSIEIFDESGAPLFAFTDSEHLSEPSRLVVDSEGRMYVIDANDSSRIKLYNYRGEFLEYLTLPGLEDRAKVSITAIALDANGDLYLGESKSGQVLVFDGNRKQKMRFGTPGEDAGQFSGIVGIALDASNIYVASQSGTAVQVFTRNGRYLRGWGYHDAGLQNVSLPAGIAVDDKGRVILVDTLRQEIKYFDPEGRLIDIFGGLGKGPGQVAYPLGISRDRKGRLCIADGGNRRAQVLTPVEAPPRAVPAAEPAAAPDP